MKQILAVLIVVLLASCFGTTPEKTELKGQSLPDFRIQLHDSITTFKTSQIPKGQPFFLLYFSPECPYCQGQMDEIISNYDQLKTFKIFLVSNFTASSIRAFYNHFNLQNFKNIIVGHDVELQMANYFNLTGIPYWAIYDENKELKNVLLGIVKSKQLKKLAEE